MTNTDNFESFGREEKNPDSVLIRAETSNHKSFEEEKKTLYQFRYNVRIFAGWTATKNNTVNFKSLDREKDNPDAV